LAKRLRDLYLNRPLYRDTFIYKDISSYRYKDKARLSEQAIKDFQDLHERKFSKRPSIEEAERDLTMLMRIVDLTNRPTTKNKDKL
jgi:hypothetical protein